MSKLYNVMFRATVDCSMEVSVGDDVYQTDGFEEAILQEVKDQCFRATQVDDWVEPDDEPRIEIDDWVFIKQEKD